MIESINSQINRAKLFLKELEDSYNNDCLQGKISESTKNSFSEVLTKMRFPFDQLMCHFVECCILDKYKLPEEKKEQCLRLVSFPFLEDGNEEQLRFNLKNQAGRMKQFEIGISSDIENLHERFPAIYRLIDSAQHYNIGNEWVRYFIYNRNKTHRTIDGQKIKENSRLNLGRNSVILENSTNITFNNGYFSGIIANGTFNSDMPIENIDPKLEPIQKKWNTITIKGTDVDILELSKKVVYEGERFLNNFIILIDQFKFILP